jgi:NAD(P)-dependent dehydrogenase (short-subunit alcohol dehydrogenase family)
MAVHEIFDITGKVALVTGASRGLGRTFAETMAEFGADVACVGRDEKKLAETVQILKKSGHRVISIKADVTKESDIKRMVSETVKQLGKIDILFNNAGTGTLPVKIHEMPVEDWDMVMNTNLRSIFLGMKYVIPEMLKTKKGSIINISSIAGLRAEVPEVAPASYGATKAAMMNLTQVAAMEYVMDGIRVNCIAPGMHKSEIGTTSEMSAQQLAAIDKMQRDYCKAEVPMQRLADAEELKGLAILLASDASSFITGQIFIQDGGQSARL